MKRNNLGVSGLLRNGQVFVSRLNVELMGMMFGGTIAHVMGMAGTDLKAVIALVPAK